MSTMTSIPTWGVASITMLSATASLMASALPKVSSLGQGVPEQAGGRDRRDGQRDGDARRGRRGGVPTTEPRPTEADQHAGDQAAEVRLPCDVREEQGQREVEQQQQAELGHARTSLRSVAVDPRGCEP